MIYFGYAVKKLWIFGTFLIDKGDIMDWLEKTCFWFIMILCVLIYVGGLHLNDYDRSFAN